jgi:signal transduction histidine kinase
VRRRLLLSYLSLTLFVLLALGLPLGVSFSNAEHRRLTSQVENDAFALALHADGPLADASAGDPTALDNLIQEFTHQTGVHVVVVDRDGRVLAAAGRGEPGPGEGISGLAQVDSALRGREVTGERRTGHGRVLSSAVPVLSSGVTEGAVLVSSSLRTAEDRTSRNWLLLAALGGIIALVVLLVSVLLARSFTKPVTELDRAAARLGEGDLRTRVPVPEDPPELNGLAKSFNATAAHLEDLVQLQQSFVVDASHQLRSPLAALRLRLENVEAEGPDFRAEDLEGALTEVRRLTRLVDGLLLLARTDHASAPTAALDLEPIVEGRREAWEALATERGVRIDVDIEPVVVRSVPGRLEQVLDNLLGNALEVAPHDSAVRVVARGAGDSVRLEVRDGGPGMTAEQRARAFDRFWRAEPSRKQLGGFGLGLAIVKRLVTADGGRVELAPAPEGGLAVIVRLRRATRAAEAADVCDRSDQPAAAPRTG